MEGRHCFGHLTIEENLLTGAFTRRDGNAAIKRDMEISRDEVRVMTVHGAKGLEAPVVFLIDTTSSPADTQRLNLIRLPGGNAAPGSVAAMVWAAVWK